MARYTPQFIASVRHDYEDTDMTLAAIAAKYGISERTVNRMRDHERWRRRSERPPRDLPPAMQLLEEATGLLTARAASDDPNDAAGRAEVGAIGRAEVGAPEDAEVSSLIRPCPPPRPRPSRASSGSWKKNSPPKRQYGRGSAACPGLRRMRSARRAHFRP